MFLKLISLPFVRLIEVGSALRELCPSLSLPLGETRLSLLVCRVIVFQFDYENESDVGIS